MINKNNFKIIETREMKSARIFFLNIEMINKHVIPSIVDAANVFDLQGQGGIAKTIMSERNALIQTMNKIYKLQDANDEIEAAKLARTLRLEAMEDVRKICDTAESLIRF